MGQKFVKEEVKVKLRIGKEKIKKQRSKTEGRIEKELEAISELLALKKDETGRIRIEGIIRDENMLHIYEVVSVLSDLLIQRMDLIANTKEVPDDLIGPLANIIYCSSRIGLKEYTEIVSQFGVKYGKNWVMEHYNNTSGKVSPKIISLLSVQPPTIEVVIQKLTACAERYGVKWEANVEDMSRKNDPNQLGSILPIIYDQGPSDEKNDDIVNALNKSKSKSKNKDNDDDDDKHNDNNGNSNGGNNGGNNEPKIILQPIIQPIYIPVQNGKLSEEQLQQLSQEQIQNIYRQMEQQNQNQNQMQFDINATDDDEKNNVQVDSPQFNALESNDEGLNGEGEGEPEEDDLMKRMRDLQKD